MLRYLSMLTMAAMLVSAAMTGPVWAQTPPPAPRPSPEAAPPQTTSGMVEGKVNRVDPVTRTVSVSTGLFGLLGKTLEVGPDTQISVDGRTSSLVDIREGAKVKAAYETRNGKTIATRIEVLPSQDVKRGPAS